ncbi:MAG: hypothetical protein ABUS47_13210 [Steroidobacter sp.]
MKFLLLIVVILAAPSPQAASPELNKAVAAWSAPDPMPLYRSVLVDLNGDGQQDAVVLVLGSDYCGSGGCTLAIFKGTAKGFEFVSDSTITREPIYMLSETKFGWRTLCVLVEGGGAKRGQALLRFDGKKYPLNPSMQPRATDGDLKSAQQLFLK